MTDSNKNPGLDSAYVFVHTAVVNQVLLLIHVVYPVTCNLPPLPVSYVHHTLSIVRKKVVNAHRFLTINIYILYINVWQK